MPFLSDLSPPMNASYSSLSAPWSAVVGFTSWNLWISFLFHSVPPSPSWSGALRYACCEFSSYIRHLQYIGQWSGFSCEALHDSKWEWLESIDVGSNCVGSTMITRLCSAKVPRYSVECARPSLSFCAESYSEKKWFLMPELIWLMVRENRVLGKGLQVVR